MPCLIVTLQVTHCLSGSFWVTGLRIGLIFLVVIYGLDADTQISLKICTWRPVLSKLQVSDALTTYTEAWHYSHCAIGKRGSVPCCLISASWSHVMQTSPELCRLLTINASYVLHLLGARSSHKKR